jgi:hypothetical protein
MSDRVYQAFVLRTPSVWRAVIAFVKAKAQACLDRDSPLVVIVTTAEHDATDEQRAFWHAVIIKRFADEVPDDGGELRPPAWWHEKLVLDLLGMSERVSASGQIKRQRRSTGRGQITVGEYADLITRAQVLGAQRGIDWD